ncbi:MAG: CoA ester lyase [Deltaproteobacteria bacterium]|nr:CoA ester lyase [Deltaproteobacteria bacterium]
MKPRRSILSVPGHVQKMHAKALDSSADVVMLDMEDSVPLDAKEAARAQVVDSLLSMAWGDKTVAVRINGLDTGYGYQDILAVAEAAGGVVDTIVVPKVDHPRDIHCVSRLLDGIEMNRGIEAPIGIEASIESAAGLEQVSRTACASRRLKTLIFGIADYSASIGARLVSISGHGEKEDEIYPGHRWHFPLSRVVMASKAHGLMAIDAPYGNFKDIEGLKKSAAMAAALGFNGKWVIHPGQIDAVNAVFSPSAEDLSRAERVIKAHEEAVRAGRGAVAVDGRMVDNATIRLARQLWEQARYLKLRR